jgi:two-component system, NarL family, response regulator NreC
LKFPFRSRPVRHEPITIVLADDHTIVRQGLANLLNAEPGFQVVGEAENGRQAVRKVEELRPDVVIMDIAMPILNGIEAGRQVRKISPATKLIILSMHSHDRYISELLSLGASGYLLKEASRTDIIQAIHTAMKGDTFLSPSISRKVVEEYVSLKKAPPRESLYNRLSNREREVFQMLAEGHSTRKIAETLFVSSSTVKTHRVNIMEKLELENASQLVQFAIQLGIVDIQD